VFYRVNLAPVDIHGIGNGLKGVKGNTHGKQDHAHIEVRSSELVRPQGKVVHNFNIQAKNLIDGVNKKVGILEIREHEEVDEHAHEDPELFPADLPRSMDHVPQVVVGKCGKDKDHEKQAGGFPVEKEAGPKKEGIPHCTLPVYTRINQQNHCIEGPEEQARENQRFLRMIKEYVS